MIRDWVPQYVYLVRDLAELAPGSYRRFEVLFLDLVESRLIMACMDTGERKEWHRVPSRSSGYVLAGESTVRWESGPPMEVF